MKKCIILLGATCSNKTSLAYAFAKVEKIPIISADSRQCFKELNIGVAKPNDTMLADVPHYFINSHSIHEEMSSKIFERYALESISEIFKTHSFSLMVGGSGLYIKAFSEGIIAIPAIPEHIREEIHFYYEKFGMEGLQTAIRQEDPLFFATGAIHNPRRIIRALSVKRTTGYSILKWQNEAKPIQRPFEIIKIGIALDRHILYENIEKRVVQMLDEGLITEVEKLMPYRHLPNLQTIGYKEIFAYLKGEYTLGEAVSLIKQHTRNYAKRQLTWFRADKKIKWIKSNQVLEELATFALRS